MDNLKSLLEMSVKEIIENSTCEDKFSQIYKKHNEKIHFIPKQYRVLGGILQSMNIQFGNFLESVMGNILKANPNIEILSNFSGKKSNMFSLTEQSEEMIDSYITDCQTANYSEDKLLVKFNQLVVQINKNEINMSLPLYSLKHDVDILFKDKIDNKIYYCEIKYNDDHDTGKFIDINRKFLKTFAYLVREFKTKDSSATVKPILFYFNNKRMKGNIYVPEKEVIYRGKRFFDTFTTVNYDTLDNYMQEISESTKTKQIFDDLYKKVMKT